MPMRQFAYATLLISGVTAAAPAIAGPLSGTFSSPLGRVAVREKGGIVTGTIAEKKNPCGFPKGQKVLDGSRLDDSIVGTLHACKVGTGCSGPVQGAAMLLITHGGAALSGAVHLETGKCETPLKGDSVAFRKSARAGHAASVSKGSGTPRQRAEKLAAEANATLKENDGDAEAARAKFIEATKVDPNYAEGYIGVGVTYYARERYDEALDWYKKAIEANPAIGDAYYNIACVYALKGDTAQALRYLRIALLNGYVQLNTLQSDPDLKSLQGNPTFEKYKTGQAG